MTASGVVNKRIIHTESGEMTFELDMAAGQVEILLEDRERAEVLLEPLVAGDEIAADLISRTLHVSRGPVLDLRMPHPEPTVLSGSGNTTARGVGGGGVKVTARLPHGSRLKATTVSANVAANEYLPTADFESTSGDLYVFSTDRLGARTISGEVSVDTADRVDVETTSGDVTIGEANDIRARTVSGDIDAGRLTGSCAQLTSTSGRVDVFASCDAEVTARTVSGDIRITAHDGAHVNARATSMSGRVRIPRN